VGDGTTSIAVLCGELLREAEQLVNQRIHPQMIAAGWRLARNVARKVLEMVAIDHSADDESFRKDLLRTARTTLSSKLVAHEKEYFAELAVDAIMRVKGSNNLDYIQVMKMSGRNYDILILNRVFYLIKQ